MAFQHSERKKSDEDMNSGQMTKEKNKGFHLWEARVVL
jgi:hypothetical protein